MPRRLLVPLLASVLLLGAAACSDPEEEEPAPPTTAAPPPVAELQTVELSAVELGGQPRQSMLLDVSTPQVWNGRIEFGIGFDQARASATGPSTVSLNNSTGTDAAAATGGVGPLDVRLEDPATTRVPDAIDYDMAFEVTPARVITSAETTLTESPEVDELGQPLGEIGPELPWFIFPVPEEPVGVGATWQLAGDLVLFGGTSGFDARVRVADIGPEAYRLVMDVELTLPGEDGSTLTGTGQIEGHPSRLAPERAEIDVTDGQRSLRLVVRRRDG